MYTMKGRTVTFDITLENKSKDETPSIFTTSWMPYMELARLHKPAAITHIYAPFVFGCLYAACTSETPVSTYQVTLALVSLFITAFILRAVGCVWNDIVDRDFDAVTERCKTRPMARGAISLPNAYTFCAALWLLWACALQQTATKSAVLYSLPVPILSFIYPYGKRFTYYPQVFLGLGLSLGCLIGAAQLDRPLHSLLLQSDPSAGYGLVALFLSYTLWTIVYDVVYAFQDLKDDIKSGVLSMAVLLANRPIFYLSLFSIAQMMCLVAVGYFSHFSMFYYLVSCGGPALLSSMMLSHIDITNTGRCLGWFKFGALVYDALMILGLTLGGNFF